MILRGMSSHERHQRRRRRIRMAQLAAFALFAYCVSNQRSAAADGHRPLSQGLIPAISPSDNAQTAAPPSFPTLPSGDLTIVLAPAAVAIDHTRRGVLLPFEIGSNLPDDTQVDYTVSVLDRNGKPISETSGRRRSRGGRSIGDVKLTIESKTAHVRFIARAIALGMAGTTFATVTVPDDTLQTPACGGFVFEQSAARRGIRDFAQSSPLTISTLVWAQRLNGTVAPLSFALGSAGGVPHRRWPVQLGIPLANGLWRVAFTLRPPFPAGNMEVRILRADKLLADSCITQFSSR